MKALIVDGEEMFRLSMREVVSVAATFDEIIEAGSEADFVAKTARHNKLDLVIIHPSSLSRQSSPNGLEDGKNCLNLVRRLYPAAPVLIISDTHGSNDIWPEANIVSRGSSVTTMITKIRASLSLPAESPVRSFSAPATPQCTCFHEE
jgi:DNA-binding NarL/FixJ family response regulator